MNSKEDKINIDPDYARNNTALRNIIKKDEENNIDNERLYTIIAEEFDKELTTRQNQLEEIEEKIAKAQKLLHILRYVLITSYYNKNLEHKVKESETDSGPMGVQNRIHPAIKKLLGKNGKLNVFSNLGKRKAVQKNCDKNEASTSQATTPKKIKTEPKLVKSKVQGIDSNQNCLQNRKKTQHRIIIGNISKYMPSLDNDNTTHKWMIYVRGDKDKADISNIVERVKFYLHPSYTPHDIVEICEPPFHLSRRGWGEFPLRVQIIFKCKLNKPVEIVHNLKLDKTCSGRQVLGNETLVDVFLHEELPQVPNLEPGTSQESVEPLTIKHESLHHEILIKDEPDDQMDSFLSNTEDFMENSYSPIDLDLDGELMDLNFGKKTPPFDLFKKPLDINADKRKLLGLKLEEKSFNSELFKRPLDPDRGKKSVGQTLDRKNITLNCDKSYFTCSNQLLETKLKKTGQDHDYCQGEIEDAESIDIIVNSVKEEPPSTSSSIMDYSFYSEHSYCIPLDDSGETNIVKFEPIEELICDNSQHEENLLRFGLDESYLDNVSSETKDHYPRKSHSLTLNKPIKIILQTSNQTVLTNGHLVTLTTKNTPTKYSLVTPIGSSQKPTKSSYRIPQNKFRNMGEVLPYLMKRFPLWSEQAKDLSYKRTFPYVATSKQEYESWNMGKRVNAEWNRAKTLQKILCTESMISDVERWTVKTFFMYSRSHLYSPPIGFSIFKKLSIELSLINSCFANTFSQGNRKRSFPMHDDEAVDIESEQDHTISNLKSDNIDISDPSFKPQCSYIKEVALDAGVVLKPEEILEGVMFNGTERMILEAVKCLAEGLIRRAHHYAVCSGNYRPNITEVSTTDVKLALSERSEFKSLEEFRRKRQTMYYFS